MKQNDDMFVIVKAGSASGVVVLLGQLMAGGERWFTLVVVDHPVELESAQDLERIARQAPADRLARLPRGPQRDRQWQEWQRVLREAGGASG